VGESPATRMALPEHPGSQAHPSICQRLADFVTRVRYEDLPREVVVKAKEEIVFLIARAFEGAGSPEAHQVRHVLASCARSDGVHVIADSLRLDASDAALFNCALMRGAGGRDDVLWPAGVHAGSVTLPTALALAEATHASGETLIVSLVLAYEILGKLGTVADSWATRLPRRPTNVYGPFGPITAAAYLLRLDRVHVANAFGYAANLGIGVPEGGMMDNYYGLVNRNGILAARLAGAGGMPYTLDIIEGSTGLYRSFFGHVPRSLDRAMGALGKDWEVMTAEIKPYPGTGQNAPAIYLLLQLAASERLTPQNVVEIEVVQPHATDSEPRRREVAFQGPFVRSVQAYSSLPYALAVALIDGHVGLSRFPDADDLKLLNDPRVARLMKRINLRFEAGHASPRYCRLRVRLTDGRVLRREVERSVIKFPREEWGPALQEFGDKVLPRAQLQKAEAMLLDLEKLTDVSELMRTLAVDRSVTQEG
jgi:2-methylcitrate dehydratase PrpD